MTYRGMPYGIALPRSIVCPFFSARWLRETQVITQFVMQVNGVRDVGVVLHRTEQRHPEEIRHPGLLKIGESRRNFLIRFLFRIVRCLFRPSKHRRFYYMGERLRPEGSVIIEPRAEVGELCEPTAALGCVQEVVPALEGRYDPTLVSVLPIQGDVVTGFTTQGGATRLRRCALPWAQLWLPHSGRRESAGRRNSNASIGTKTTQARNTDFRSGTADFEQPTDTLLFWAAWGTWAR